MKKRVGVLTDDKILYNKIRLILRDCAEVSLIGADSDVGAYRVIFQDARCDRVDLTGAIILGKGGDIPLPFRHEEILATLENAAEGNAIELSGDGRGAIILGESVKLTELEYKLLDTLLSHDGFISREELLKAVWDGECDAGIVNVYVYYLRKKIEKSGNKIIISSRNEGYGIEEKYRRKG